MAIAFDDVGSWASTGSTATPTVAVPAGVSTGSILLVFASWKSYTITASMAGGWAEITEFAGGSVAPTSNGTGSMKVGAWWKEHDGSESDPTLTFSAIPSVAAYVMIGFTKDGSESWADPVAATGVVSPAESWLVSGSTDPGVAGGDALIGLVGFTNNSILMTRGNDSLDSPVGITWAGNTQQAPATHLDTSTGTDMCADLVYRLASSGTSADVPTQDGQLDNAEVGTALWVRLRTEASGQLVTPDTLALTTASFAPVIKHQVNVPVKTLTTASFAPVVKSGLVVPVASLSITSFAPTVSTTGNLILTPGTLALSTSLLAPTVTASDTKTVTPSTLALSTTAFEPTVSATTNALARPTTLGLILTTFAPSVTSNASTVATPSTLELEITAFEPTVLAPRVVTPSTLAHTVTPFIPSVRLGQTVTPGTASLSTNTFIPKVNLGFVVPTATLSVTTFAPTVSVTTNTLVRAGLASVTITPFVPQIRLTVTPSTLGLTLTTFAPSVTVEPATVWCSPGTPFLYEVANWGTVIFAYEVYYRAVSGTGKARLYDATAGLPVATSELTTVSATMVRERSGPLALLDGHEYMPQFGAVPPDEVGVQSARLVVI